MSTYEQQRNALISEATMYADNWCEREGKSPIVWETYVEAWNTQFHRRMNYLADIHIYKKSASQWGN